MEHETGSRWLRWLLLAALIASVGACALVEPMRWRLPTRYMVGHLDIYRTGFGDFQMCMRVALTPDEAQAFVDRSFAPEDRVSRPVPVRETMCPAPFWPNTFRSATMGLNIDHWPNGQIEGSTGVVYEDGFLYFWSNTM